MYTGGLPTGDTEDLQVAAVAVNVGSLHRIVEEPVKQDRVEMGRASYQVPFCYTPPIPTHLLIIVHKLLLAMPQNDGLKFTEMMLRFLQVGLGVLLLMMDELEHFLLMLFCDAGALLPLLDALGQDFINAAGREDSKKWNR